jgi:hypothetical protein
MMKHAIGTPVPQMIYETTRVLDAREGEKGMMAAETTPPDAAATTEETMGRSQTAATLSNVCFWRVNLYCQPGCSVDERRRTWQTASPD